jgi:hypothetical protein
MQIHQSGFVSHAALHLPTVDTLDAFRVSLHTSEQLRQALDALDPFVEEYAAPAWKWSAVPQELESAA